VWITLNKLPYALIQEGLLRPNMQHHERLCGRLLHTALWVSEKNSSRKPDEQGRLPTPRYHIGIRVDEYGYPKINLLGFLVNTIEEVSPNPCLLRDS
jgi:hypothetical protein